MLEFFWTALLFPLIGAAVNGLLGKRLPRRAVAAIACLTVLAAFAVSLFSVLELVNLPGEERFQSAFLFTWIESGSFRAEASFLLDPLSSLMILIVTGVGFLIHLYSVGYMRDEEGNYRYFAYLNLFIFMMSVLVLADNYLLMFVGWEGVGLCSYLLIGFYFKERFAGDAAKKAFIVNRIGDFAFLLGMFLVFREFGGLNYLEVFGEIQSRGLGLEAGFGIIGLITLLFFIGATGKSAQIPLFVWLPDAMAGPTPVSALIHAATMVTAGVYMIARSSALYSRSAQTLLIIAIVGAATALLAALIAVAQRDIKKVLAYSTVSQLGYMFLACGVGAYTTGIFHLMTHAFFKALLFLGSGSIILALHHQQDLFKMGGLRKYLPYTWATMGIGTLAITGLPLLSGFFSKDEILFNAFVSPHGSQALWLVGVVVAGLTAFYMFRMMLLAFHGDERIEMGGHQGDDHSDQGHEGHESKPQEPGWMVILPLVLLAVLSFVGGWIGLPAWLSESNVLHRFLEPSFAYAYVGEAGHEAHHSVSLELGLGAVATLAALMGFAVAFWAYVRRPEIPSAMAQRFSGTYGLLRRKFLVDEFYDGLIVHPLRKLSSSVLWRGFDVGLIDGTVNGVAALVEAWSQLVRRLQSGYVRSYAGWIVVGTALVFLFYLTH